jgi:hypothetical protein
MLERGCNVRGCVQPVAYAVAVAVYEIEDAGRQACECRVSKVAFKTRKRL